LSKRGKNIGKNPYHVDMPGDRVGRGFGDLVYPDRRNSVVPGVTGFLSNSPIPEIDNVLAGSGARASEIAIIENGDASVTKYANRGNFVAVTS